MALTPDDVVNKQFQHVRFKDGFDPDEVDDFLDEIVLEWRKTLEENAELKAKLAALESGEAAAPAAVDAPEAAAETAVVDAVPAAVVEAPAENDAKAASSAKPALSTTATAGIIELAQRLHDEHVAEGEAKRLKLVSEAESEVERIRSEAAAKHAEESTRLEKERTALEEQIAQLKTFEHDYRTQLRDYIESQLRDLDQKSTIDTSSAPSNAS